MTPRSAALRAVGVAALLALLGATAPPAGAERGGGGPRTSVEVYDAFEAPGGYGLDDYAERWATPYGPGEMAAGGTRSFAGGALTATAVPFRTGADTSVYDHIKYLALSTRAFPVPEHGWVEFSATIDADTPGVQPGRVVRGTYVQSGQPWSQVALEGQQAAATLHMIDFATGQLFDWFVSGSSAFTLVERLPSVVTGSPGSGRDEMHTQIVDEVPLPPGPHRVALRFSRGPAGGTAEWLLDGRLVSRVDDVGVPLGQPGQQAGPWTGTWPALGPGEELGDRMDAVVIGHGLFSLLDAFPFQHPDAPELSVSIPVQGERLFGQGARGVFDDVVVRTRTLG